MREVAREERAALGLGQLDPFDPYALAEAHGIAVYTLSDLRDWELGADAYAHFNGPTGSRWSAALLPLGTARVIVENDGHATARRRSNVAHELGHHLLEHPFDAVILGEDHQRQFDQQQEKQAGFLAGELLVPEEAARKAAYSRWTNGQVAEAYSVSDQIAQMQMSGPRIIADRASKKYGYR
jgi:hypothetical protein